MEKILSTILIILFIQFSFGQNIKHFNKENSDLTDNDIWGIAVDKHGNKWLGTAKSGLIKFDGKEFTTFDASNSVIKGKYISPIFIDSKDNIWTSFSQPNGLVKFDGEDWTTYSGNEMKLSKISIIDISEDENGIIYFGGSNGLTSFNGTEWKKIKLPKNVTIRALAIKSDQEIYIGHNNGLLIYKNSKWESLTTENSELQQYVRSLRLYNDNELYVGYGGNITGGYSILKNDKWNHVNKDNSDLSNNMVRDIEVDDKGNYWMATNNGLNIVSKDKIQSILFQQRGNAILDIAIENNIAWIATSFGLFKIEI
jgi:ligand-binding sensor domain-containing protein